MNLYFFAVTLWAKLYWNTYHSWTRITISKRSRTMTSLTYVEYIKTSKYIESSFVSLNDAVLSADFI